MTPVGPSGTSRWSRGLGISCLLLALSACGTEGFEPVDAGVDQAAFDAAAMVPVDSSIPVDGALSVSCDGGLSGEGCPCDPASSPRSCYPGPASQAGVGLCTLGQQTCAVHGEFAGTWGACVGAGAPKSCASAGAGCGMVSDGCGGMLDCGGCDVGKTCGGGGTPNQCGAMPCAPLTVSFDWGSHGAGPCTATISGTTNADWIYTPTTDAYVGGFFASCVDGAWVISDEKCAQRGSSTTCHAAGTRCDGSGPASFPYEHCWACCNTTDVNGPNCL